MIVAAVVVIAAEVVVAVVDVGVYEVVDSVVGEVYEQAYNLGGVGVVMAL